MLGALIRKSHEDSHQTSELRRVPAELARQGVATSEARTGAAQRRRELWRSLNRISGTWRLQSVVTRSSRDADIREQPCSA